jgi:hypothetical protein
LQYAASGMDAQHSALDVLARNVASTQTADSAHPVHPLVPQFAVLADDDLDDDGIDFNRLVGAVRGMPGNLDASAEDDDDDDEPLAGQVEYAGATPSPRAVTAIEPDSATIAPAAGMTASDALLFGGLIGNYAAAGTALARAQQAESAFAAGGGSLQEMVFERARADAILNVASAAASKASQSLTTVLNIQV